MEHEKHIRPLKKNILDIVLVLDKNLNYMLSTDNTPIPGDIKYNEEYETGFAEIFDKTADKKWIAATEKKIKDVYYEGKRLSYEEKIKFLNTPDYRYYFIDIIPFQDYPGTDIGLIFILRDTTDLINAKIAAENANKAKSQFLASISHDIRTPMYAIVGLNELISKEPLSTQQKSYFENVKKSANLLLSIINDLLDYANLETNQLKIVKSVFNLRELIENLTISAVTAATVKGILFETTVSKDVPVLIETDQNRLKQILNNILDNAVKYTNKGKINFFVSFRKNRVFFDVSDTGTGINPEDIKKLFTPYDRSDINKKKNLTGSGLGLAITKNLCDLMGGELSVKSKRNLGSTFSVSFPYELLKPNILNTVPDEEINFLAESANVLVVDDISINLTIVEVQLSEFGISPLMVSNGKHAVDAVLANDFDLILMDQIMPEMDGIEATLQIRKLGGKYNKIPIVALTANATADARENLLNNGFNDFLTKPLDPDVLKNCLLKWLPPEKITII